MKTIGIYGLTDPLGQQRSHDHGVALFENGSLLRALELERYSGIKHDGQLSSHLEDIIAPWLGLGTHRYALANSFLGNGFTSKQGNIRFPENVSLSVPEMAREVAPNHWLVCHEMAHIGACLPFYGAFKPNSLLIHIDGGASESCASAWFYDGISISHLDHGWHSELKTAINNFNDNPLTAHILNTTLDAHLSMPGKLMGLASYGNYCEVLHRKLVERQWNVSILEEGMDGPQVLFDIAKCMQKEFENQVLHYIAKYKVLTNAEHLFYSGGAALNIHTNTRIENELGFSHVFIPPVPSDCGLAIGAGAIVEWLHGKFEPKHNAFQQEPTHFTSSTTQVTIFEDIEKAAELIAAGHVVGCFQGLAELGPRALGHRSLLARPDQVDVRKHLSETMKQREWYRPVAPMMLEETAMKALVDYNPESNLSKYMLGAWKVHKEWEKAFAGCIHADGTVRAQVVRLGEQNDHIYKILLHLRDHYGIHGAINTSFNNRGMPIVNTVAEASKQLKDMGGEYLWIET